MALVQKETIPFAGCVTLQNKFNYEFAEIQAPQEIAGFLLLPSVASVKEGLSSEASAKEDLSFIDLAKGD